MSDLWGDEGQPVCPILERSMVYSTLPRWFLKAGENFRKYVCRFDKFKCRMQIAKA